MDSKQAIGLLEDVTDASLTPQQAAKWLGAVKATDEDRVALFTALVRKMQPWSQNESLNHNLKHLCTEYFKSDTVKLDIAYMILGVIAEKQTQVNCDTLIHILQQLSNDDAKLQCLKMVLFTAHFPSPIPDNDRNNIYTTFTSEQAKSAALVNMQNHS